MSGHANFSAIDGVRPTLPTIQQTGEDIGVSLNKSVGGVNGPGAPDAGGVPPNRNNGWYDDVVTVGSKKVGASFKGKAYVGSRILHLTEGYFRRNIMSAIAKSGWFD